MPTTVNIHNPLMEALLNKVPNIPIPGEGLSNLKSAAEEGAKAIPMALSEPQLGESQLMAQMRGFGAGAGGALSQGLSKLIPSNTTVKDALRHALTTLSFSPVAGMNVPESMASPVAGKLVSPQGDIMPPEFFNTVKQSAQPIYDNLGKLLSKLGGKGK
jgi:hypothetical protein